MKFRQLHMTGVWINHSCVRERKGVIRHAVICVMGRAPSPIAAIWNVQQAFETSAMHLAVGDESSTFEGLPELLIATGFFAGGRRPLAP